MRRSQVAYRSLPPRQASHALFVGAIVGKYGGMQRSAGKLPLTHRISASSDRKKNIAPKPTPLQVQIMLPNPAPSPVRVIERERPVYRDRPAAPAQSHPLTHSQPKRNDAAEPSSRVDRKTEAAPPVPQPAPSKERVIEREKVIERERIVQRKEIVERERIVEKKVVIVREVERIIHEQRMLREQAVTLPIRGNDAVATPAADLPLPLHLAHGNAPGSAAGMKPTAHSPKQAQSRALPAHNQQPAQTTNVQPKQQTQINPLLHAKEQVGTDQPVRHNERPTDAEDQPNSDYLPQDQPTVSSDMQHIHPTGTPEPIKPADRANQAVQSNQSIQAVQPVDSGQNETSSRLFEPVPETRASVRKGQPADPLVRNLTWPLQITRKSGWRTPAKPIQSGGSTPPSGRKTRGRNRKKKRAPAANPSVRTVTAKSPMAGVTLINRKTRRNDVRSERPLFRLSSEMPAPLRERQSAESPSTAAIVQMTKAGNGTPIDMTQAGNGTPIDMAKAGDRTTIDVTQARERAPIAMPQSGNRAPIDATQASNRTSIDVSQAGNRTPSIGDRTSTTGPRTASKQTSMANAQAVNDQHPATDGHAASRADPQGFDTFERQGQVMAGRAIIADQVRWRYNKPRTYRFVDAWRTEGVPERSGEHSSSTKLYVALAHLVRSRNSQQNGAPTRAKFLQGEDLHRRTIPLTWTASQPASTGAAVPTASGHSADAAQAGRQHGALDQRANASHSADAVQASREQPTPEHNGRREGEAVAESSPTRRWTPSIDREQWPSLHPVHVRRGTSPDRVRTDADDEARTGIDDAWPDQPESPAPRTQAAMPNLGPADNEPDANSAAAVQAKLVRAGQADRIPTVHARRQNREAPDHAAPIARGRMKQSGQHPDVQNAQSSMTRPMQPLSVSQRVISGQLRATGGKNAQAAGGSGGNQSGSKHEHNSRNFIRNYKPLSLLSHASRSRMADKRSVQAPGRMKPNSGNAATDAGRNSQGLDAQVSRTPDYVGRGPNANHASASGTIAEGSNPATIGLSEQHAIPRSSIAQDDGFTASGVPSRVAAVWRARRAAQQPGTAQSEQASGLRAASALSMTQRRQSPLQAQRQSPAGRSPTPQSAAAIAMQPAGPIFEAASAAAMPLSVPTAAASSTSVQSQSAPRTQRALLHSNRAPRKAQAGVRIASAMQPTDLAVTETAFAAVPLAYATAQTTATATASVDRSAAAVVGSTPAPPMELRRQPAQPTAPAPAPEASASPHGAKSAIDQEQLQQAISKLNLLNPDQIADQVYKALARRMKFEQRLQGY